MFRALTDYGVSGRAVKQEKVSIECWNPRDFAYDNYQTVDDRPYEGIDERLIEREVDEEWSLGDFVLSGGELAAMTLMDAVIRLVPGVLGHDQSAQQDSFMEGLLDCPHYTRPEVYEGQAVPDVLLSGNHEKIRQWRLKQSLGRTWQRRPDLLEALELTNEQQRLLTEYLQELEQNSADC